ncbi:MAG: helix-turn-helix domain-containing protein [Bacteroidales bacterium]|jgi:hypothetical protein|nr:helix-turn-helix domain-containing protein [Bacteroidales bacterium]
MSQAEQKRIAESIIKENAGQTFFNYGEAAKIIGCGRNTVARRFLLAGILVKKVGPSKRVSAHDIAELMCSGRVSPVGN